MTAKDIPMLAGINIINNTRLALSHNSVTAKHRHMSISAAINTIINSNH